MEIDKRKLTDSHEVYQKTGANQNDSILNKIANRFHSAELTSESFKSVHEKTLNKLNKRD